MPRFPVTALRSVELRVPDLAAALRFQEASWGLTLAHHARGRAWLRGSGADASILRLEEGPPAIASLTFRTVALDAVLARAQAAGATLLHAPAPLDEPGGGLAATLRSPEGFAIRLVAGDAPRRPDATPRPDVPERLAHVNLNCRDVDASARFFEEGLDFALSDRSKLMAFERCNAEHHAVVLAEAPMDGLNHVAFTMAGWEAVMRASGRMVDAGFPIGWGPGRHGPGDNVFSYFVDPFGFVLEYTAEVEQVGEDHVARGPAHWTWPPGRTDQWGIAPPKSAACKAAQLAIGFA